MGEALTASLTGPEDGHVPSRCIVGERENIPAIEVTLESPAPAQGEKKVMTAEKKRAGEICEATCQMEHARSVLRSCDVFFLRGRQSDAKKHALK